jgi:hypothetical protein
MKKFYQYSKKQKMAHGRVQSSCEYTNEKNPSSRTDAPNIKNIVRSVLHSKKLPYIIIFLNLLIN